jgi:hypothetical protein
MLTARMIEGQQGRFFPPPPPQLTNSAKEWLAYCISDIVRSAQANIRRDHWWRNCTKNIRKMSKEAVAFHLSYGAFTDKAVRICHFPSPGWNCMTHRQAVQIFPEKRTGSPYKNHKLTLPMLQQCLPGAWKWQLRSTLSVNALYFSTICLQKLNKRTASVRSANFRAQIRTRHLINTKVH